MADPSGVPVQNSMSLQWCFGFNKDIVGGVHNLTDEFRQAIFYVSAHTGVIYDYERRKQKLLQGHCNPITCVAISQDKRWIATADTGTDSMIVIWDSQTSVPIKTIFNPHPEGVVAMDMSADSMYLVTLSAGAKQEIALWEWTVDRDTPLLSSEVAAKDQQLCVLFNPEDCREIVSNGAKRVIFWTWEDDALRFYSPALSSKDFKQPVGTFTVSIFLPNTRQVITGTSDGDILVWDQPAIPDQGGRATDRKASKIVKLHNYGGINFLAVHGKWIVSGGADGYVRFFDEHFRIVTWYEDMDAGPVGSISFSTLPPRKRLSDEDALTVENFEVPDFVVGTKNALIVLMNPQVFEHMEADERRGDLLVQGLDGAVHGLATHPSLEQFAVTGYSGHLHMWDYAKKKLLLVRVFDKLLGQCCVFDPEGRYLVVGFTNGTVKVLSASTLEDLQTFRNSKDCVTSVCFSHDTAYFATADADLCVGVYRFGPRDEDPMKPSEWVYVGKYRSHLSPITGLQFGVDDYDQPRLVSVSEDRTIVEYDLENSRIATGIKLLGVTRVEQSAVPTTLAWMPRTGTNRDLVLANDQYKFKLFNTVQRNTRKTVLAPAYGGPVNNLIIIPGPEANNNYMAYSTQEKVVGLIKLPLDGNPNRTMGLIAHPGELSDIASCHTGQFILTGGGLDCTVNLWQLDLRVIDANIRAGGDGVEPFVNLLEGGRHGDFYEEIVDYFHYAQLRKQGENTTSPRNITGKVPLSEIPNLVRALGYYPSEREIDELLQEIKMSKFAETGKYAEEVSLDEFIQVYVNHRPVFGITKDHISNAFHQLGADPVLGLLNTEALMGDLQNRGEPMTDQELERCLVSLLGDVDPEEAMGPELSAREFAEKVLGFEDYDDEQEQEEGNEPDHADQDATEGAVAQEDSAVSR